MNIDQAKEKFIEYVGNYDLENEKIRLKLYHSLRVAEVARRIAKDLNINEDLAELIGLLHDIGRFEQIKRFNTFNDKNSIDHAILGVEILKQGNFIKEFIDDDSYYETIYIAIENHNKFQIAKDVKGEALVYAKLIRDADKIDILDLHMHEMDYLKRSGLEEARKTEISDEMWEAFINNKQTIRKNMCTKADDFLNEISFIYDVNYKVSFKIIKENNSVNGLLDIIESEELLEKDKFSEARKIANKFIEEKLEKM